MTTKLFIITGPTGVGKTKLSLALAKKIQGAIISADSMQIYKGMDLGTDKIKKEDQEGICHYGLDIIDPKEGYSVAQFQEDVTDYLKEIQKKGMNPILVGGTGLYLHSLMYALDFSREKENADLRKNLDDLYEKEGVASLRELLLKEDPEALEHVDSNNPQRLIRAIELAKAGKKKGRNFDQLREDRQVILVVLNRDREELYRRINDRVDQMLEEGLVEEVKTLVQKGLGKDDQAMKAIGYKEVLSYLEGETSYEDMVQLLKRNSRRYAKRQLTWFRRYPQAHWIDLSVLEPEEALEKMMELWRDYDKEN